MQGLIQQRPLPDLGVPGLWGILCIEGQNIQ